MVSIIGQDKNGFHLKIMKPPNSQEKKLLDNKKINLMIKFNMMIDMNLFYLKISFINLKFISIG